MSARPRRFLVTGATGFLGSHVTRALLDRGADVAILRRPRSDPRRIVDVLARVRVIEGDLTDLGPAEPAVRDFRPEVLLHLAWHGVRGPERNGPAQVAVNVPATVDLVQLAHQVGVSCWVGLGSQEEYGRHSEVLSEGTPLRPVSLYGATKLGCGMIARALCEVRGLRFLWLRLFAAYGPDDEPTRLVPHTICALRAGRRPALTGGEQRWDMLYADDAARGILATVDAGCEGIFNLASGRAATVREIASNIAELIDPSRPLGFGELPYRVDEQFDLRADVTKLRRATGWNPRVDLREGLARTVAWFSEHPESCP